MAYDSLEGGYLPCDLVIPVPRDQSCKVMGWAVCLQILEIPGLSPAVTSHWQSIQDSWVWGELENPTASSVALLSWQWIPVNLWGIPLAPLPKPGSKSVPVTQGKSDSVVQVLRFADNVFYNLTRRTKGGELWEVKECQGSMALFLCLECQLPAYGYISVLHPCPGF